MLKLYFACAFVLLAATANAQPRGIDMTVPLHEEDGRISKRLDQATPSDPKCEKCEPVTLGFAINHALNMVFDDERGLSGERRYARAILGDHVKASKDAHLSSVESAEIVRCVEKAYPGFWLMQIVPVIDPNRKPPDLQ